MNIREREHHVASGGRREHFKQALGAESLLTKPAPPEPQAWCLASGGTGATSRALLRLRGKRRGIACGPRDSTGGSYCRNPIIPSALRTGRNGTVFSKSSFESCFK